MNKLHYDIGFGWGMSACQNEAPQIPINDSRIRSFIKENCKEAGSSISLLKGWADGYEWQVKQKIKEKAAHSADTP